MRSFPQDKTVPVIGIGSDRGKTTLGGGTGEDHTGG